MNLIQYIVLNVGFIFLGPTVMRTADSVLIVLKLRKRLRQTRWLKNRPHLISKRLKMLSGSN